jgi:hypothetical protein
MEEQREYVIKGNNTAQPQLLSILENLTKYVKEIEIKEALYGDLDFSVLKELGYGNIKSIILNEGQITNIIGLPEDLLHFECNRNLLISMDELPTSLKYLKIRDNFLTSIDLSTLDNLETLNVAYNKITGLEKLPKKLVELVCDNNKIERLNLTDIHDLKVLNVSNNPITLIENLPSGIVEFKMDNTPSIEFRNSTIPSFEEKEDTEETTSKNYLDSLNEYFKLKQDYETKKKDMMKKAFKNEPSRKMGKLAALSVKPPCINCKRPVGTIFSNRENDTYTAICGDKGNPCNLNIKIYNGKTINLPYILNIYKEEIEDIKDTIISQKLDTLFSYVTEEKSVQLFKKELETYNSNSKIFKNLLDKYNELYENKDKKEMIQKKSETIYLLIEKINDLLKEYEKTNNKSILKLAINMQINELYPEIRNMRLLKNEVLELNEEEEGKFKVFSYPVALNKIDYDFGEKATVIKFNKA